MLFNFFFFFSCSPFLWNFCTETGKVVFYHFICFSFPECLGVGLEELNVNDEVNVHLGIVFVLSRELWGLRNCRRKEDCCCLLKYVFMNAFKPSCLHLAISTLPSPNLPLHLQNSFNSFFIMHSCRALY